MIRAAKAPKKVTAATPAEVKKPRGRPRKTPAAETVKKPRGRPRKTPIAVAPADTAAVAKPTSPKTRRKRKAPQTNAESMLALRNERLRKFQLGNEKLERQVALESGEALPAGLVQEEIETANAIIRGRFTQTHKRLASRLAGLSEEDMQPVIRQFLDQALNELCSHIETQPP